MRLELPLFGSIPDNYPRKFYRVETYAGHRVADFSTLSEAETFARMLRAPYSNDPKVIPMRIVG